MATLSKPICTVHRLCPCRQSKASGWMTLPDELKVKILRYIINEKPAVTYLHESFASGVTIPYEAVLITHPAVSNIAKDIFYGDNKFKIDVMGRPSHLGFFVPQPAIAGFIRHLEVVVSLRVRDIKFLRKLADGINGFDHLRFLKIAFDPRWVGNFYNEKHVRALQREFLKGKAVFDVPQLEIDYMYGLRQDGFEQAKSLVDRQAWIDNLIEPLLFTHLIVKQVDAGGNLVEEAHDLDSAWQYGLAGSRQRYTFVHDVLDWRLECVERLPR
ncbi:hypothetical protein BDV95DRAFT_603112 [Massariosphaeria phaeospora]|uniref:Uncharacterized protein n=1 Tax=Massariosphaeria phaeospora TaxID=100035 RepID=A0A7C8MHP9_9PLEO|nr:hypothetical protein BDV95DRAFT_603112 [Massariosphaeria phaeospora]